MDEKIRKKLRAYKRQKTESIAAAVSNWQKGDDISVFWEKQMAIKTDIHMVETCARKPVDELKALREELQRRLDLYDILDDGRMELIADQMSAVSTVLDWHGWQYAYVTTASKGTERRWVRVDESEVAE